MAFAVHDFLAVFYDYYLVLCVFVIQKFEAYDERLENYSGTSGLSG